MTRSREQIAELAEQLRADYERGLTLKQLERRYDMAASYIGRLLKRGGVQLRPPASQNKTRREGWGGLNREQARDYQQRLAENGPLRAKRG